MAITFGYEVSC